MLRSIRESITEATLFFRVPNGPGHAIQLPHPVAALAADESIGILNEIEAAYDVDFANEGEAWAAAPHEHIGFKRREVWRIGSYVLWLCTLDGVIRRMHAHARQLSWRLKIEPPRSEDVLEERKAALKKYKFWRDKVFAHTSYAWPKGDSLSMQITAVAQFGGNAIGVTDSGVELGAGCLVVAGEEPPKFPRLAFAQMVSDAADHVQAWATILDATLAPLREFSLEQLQARCPQLVSISWTR